MNLFRVWSKRLYLAHNLKFFCLNIFLMRTICHGFGAKYKLSSTIQKNCCELRNIKYSK